MKFRPRFSVRTLAIFVTLVACYFGAWEATKRYGARQSNYGLNYGLPSPDWGALEPERWSPAPLVIIEDELLYGGKYRYTRTYSLWLFGPQIKLPFSSNAGYMAASRDLNGLPQ
jgi:hypothetical protein